MDSGSFSVSAPICRPRHHRRYRLKYRFPKMHIYLRPTNAALTSMFRTYHYHPNHKGFDLTIIGHHSLPHVRNRGRDSHWAVNSAEKQKRRRYGSACASAHIEFHPLAMDLYGTTGSHFDRAPPSSHFLNRCPPWYIPRM